jgi:hypothetical protein
MNTHQIDLGTLDLGNNHHTEHFAKEAARHEQLIATIYDLPSRDDIQVTYMDKYRNRYTDTWDVGELCSLLSPHVEDN